MNLERRLAEHALVQHPVRSALALERLGEENALPLLATCSIDGVCRVIQHVSPHFSAAVLSSLQRQREADVVDRLTLDVAARILRRLDEPTQDAILDLVEGSRAKNIRLILGFPTGSAGSLMDPSVLALPQDLTAREAVARVRAAANQARYNLYLVDQDQKLVGALNMRELLLAPPKVTLAERMTRNPHRISASADREEVLSHRGWREVHALPVVGTNDEYLGAIRYRTLRALESERLGRNARDADAGAAFGEVIAAAAGGVLDALGGASRSFGSDDDGR